MHNIKKLEIVSLYFGVFIGSILTEILYDYLKARGIAGPLLVILLFLVLAVTIQILSALCQTIINQSSVVRRIILSNDYIEGSWIDSATCNHSKSYGLYIIRYANDSYHISGREFDSEGNVIYNWQSITSSFDGDRLVYLYTSHAHIGEIMEDNYGVTSLTFIRSGPNKFPRTSTGYFIDAATNFRKVVTAAEKQSNHNLKILNNINETRQLVLKWINGSG